ncbi:MAG: error-prone DNA polymerase [Acidimicrobiales bacterium]
MGWNNPDVPWWVMEGVLSDRPRARGGRPAQPLPEGANGGDSPAWSPRRPAYEPPTEIARRANTTPYAELHCHSCFSFLDGASQPEELAEEAVRAGLEALAITDHDGLYGVVRFAEAARAVKLKTVFGAELSLRLSKPQNGMADPEGTHLLVLARDPDGYANLGTAISHGQLTGQEKGKPDYYGVDWSAVHGGHWLVLTGCRKGAVPQALLREGPAAAGRELAQLVEWFGRDNVAVELWDHGDPLDVARNDALALLGAQARVEVVATNNVHYAVPRQHRLASALAAVRARRSLDDMVGWLPPAASAHIRSGDEQARRFARWPGAVERAAELGLACAFDLSLVAPKLPPFPCPEGLDEMAYLRQLAHEGADFRYGRRGHETVPGAWAQIDHELDVIESLGFAGYFLVVWDIVKFCSEKDIYCQGRGSAANSAVCYVLGITKADAVKMGLLFERFLSADRQQQPPDIDVDIESGRREEVIQHVYHKHGRWHAAQVANVITYRSRSAVRDAAKAFGYSQGQQDAWSRQVDPWSSADKLAERSDHELPAPVVELARDLQHLPRHLGIHSGGMVICDRPIVQVCPVEWGRMEGRTVLQWDKDDCAEVGLVKFDLLGLGMLSALHHCVDMVRQAHGVEVDLATMDHTDAEVYEMLGRADSVGVFQVESRAQMATLPRLRPKDFYDLVVEVALIRPGPIQGGSVHPYLRRRKGDEEITYLHPKLEEPLRKTLGVPLFQEQLMQIAIEVAGFTPLEADQLRQAMASKRSRERMEALRQRLFDGMKANKVTEDVAELIWDKLVAFAAFGFPESHAMSFAYLVFASSWLKRYFPAAFCAALLKAQPMGFYSPHTLVQDARRHGVEVRTPDLNASGATATLESPSSRNFGRNSRNPAVSAKISEVPAPPAPKGVPPEEWGRGGPVVRMGLGSVREVSDTLAERLVAERERGGLYHDPQDLVRRVPGMTLRQLEALATAGAMGCFVMPDGQRMSRREALWIAGAVAGTGSDQLDGIVVGAEAPALPGMGPAEEARADLWATGVSPDGHPTRFVREALDAKGVVPSERLGEVAAGARVVVGGVVTHRQRPATAGGTMFVNLEDEGGLINVVVSKRCWADNRRVLQGAPALVVRGRLERADGVTNVIAQQVEPLPVKAPTRSRDFR